MTTNKINLFAPIRLSVAITVISIICISCGTREENLWKLKKESPVLTLSYWGDQWQSKPLSKRINPAPEALIKYLRIENELYGYDGLPVPADPPPAFYEALKMIDYQLSDALRRLAGERLIGLFVVNDLGSSGFAELVIKKGNQEKYAIIVLSRDVMLKRKANEWATWKENSAFRKSKTGPVTMNIIIENEQSNTVTNAVRYIILHEMGHVLGLVSDVHQTWDSEGWSNTDDYPFTKLSWKNTGDSEIISLFEENFSERKLIRYYSFEDASFSIDQAAEIFTKLQSRTNFVNLYASVDVFEDFAETFATYVHVVRSGRPWQVRIERRGRTPVIIDPCWSENRCDQKKKFMESWFENPFESTIID